ncbi:MAG: ImmA/IrrE family metallo-endopeptidase [Alphaproteobacteria bacterium]|nr:ImmA/IrrE family metallo-endopeptidase [Alphaproteobacteria bacterium]MBV9694326.1 ImmA/IrrE family metallo-endopeptidase [Alphaproteobacteria bacterium]
MQHQRRKVPAVSEAPRASNLTKDAIEKIAEQVAREMGYAPEKEISDLISAHGGRVSIKDFWKLDGTTDESIVVKPDATFEIYIPPHTSPERDRFTIAHELGHYVLHYLLDPGRTKPKGGFAASRYGNSRVEWEANWFAAGFLMPRSAFKTAFEREKSHIGRVAEHFRVSPAAAYVRARAIGLVNAAKESV